MKNIMKRAGDALANSYKYKNMLIEQLIDNGFSLIDDNIYTSPDEELIITTYHHRSGFEVSFMTAKRAFRYSISQYVEIDSFINDIASGKYYYNPYSDADE